MSTPYIERGTSEFAALAGANKAEDAAGAEEEDASFGLKDSRPEVSTDQGPGTNSPREPDDSSSLMSTATTGIRLTASMEATAYTAECPASPQHTSEDVVHESSWTGISAQPSWGNQDLSTVTRRDIVANSPEKVEFLRLIEEPPEDDDAEEDLYTLISDACIAMLRAHHSLSIDPRQFSLQQFYVSETLYFMLAEDAGSLTYLKASPTEARPL
ncbi:hypothetical protein Z517_09328 [Fonsecaea pedrosoi CBS 271.37]|uniref:Uncharacterized protein n=1 Tax=Fonsecaea pedrosoi CBS 271.37 TaxID=1442368 RepID=A0A0D2GX08_9EURO|nr:uncharacterized protein Z517_09328 [Fonsecaea pedrosoi CBS 271.37]KIW76884.1 hypothetical protein Z517_09328 [Fonsecaea pedrosoi CBS 271.37]